jgi:hypothetical protein
MPAPPSPSESELLYQNRGRAALQRALVALKWHSRNAGATRVDLRAPIERRHSRLAMIGARP